MCCHLCGGCCCSPPLSWRLGWPEEACTAVLWCLSPAPFPPASHHCWLLPSRMCCLETNMTCSVLICRKTQLRPWGGRASPGAVRPMEPESQASLSAPCWVPMASLPPQPAPSPQWASSAHCVGRSRENPPGRSLPQGKGCGASKATRPSLPLPVTAEVTRQLHSRRGTSFMGLPLSFPVARHSAPQSWGQGQGEAARGQGHQKLGHCRVGWL